MSTDEKNGDGAEDDIMIFMREATHRPQTLETEEEIYESEKARKGKTSPSFLFLSQVSPNLFNTARL